MLTKYDYFSYLLSCVINLLFLFLFFSGLTFNVYRREKIKVKLIRLSPQIKQNLTVRKQSPPVSHELKKQKIQALPNTTKISNTTKKRSVKSRKRIKKVKKVKRIKKVKKKNLVKKETGRIQVAKKFKSSEKVEKGKTEDLDQVIKEKIFKLKEKVKNKQSEVSISDEELKLLQQRLIALEKERALREKTLSEKTLNEKKSSPPATETYSSLSLEYLALVRKKLENNFDVPIYLKNKSGLSAIVKIEVSSSGKILHYSFLKRSLSSEFDKAVERCLKASSPLPVDRKAIIIIEFNGEGIETIK